VFETHVDAMSLWIALGVASAAVVGVVGALPTTAPPDSVALAETVDEVATAPAGALAHRTTVATEWRLGGRRLGLRNDAGTTHATLVGEAVPAGDGQLRRVLAGRAPAGAFESQRAFARAVRAARRSGSGWRATPERFTVRHVTWGEVDVTLLG